MSLIERWAYANRLRRRHPAEKIILAGGMLVLSLALPPFPGAILVSAVMAAATVGGAGIPAGVYLRVLATPLGFLLGGIAAMAVSLSLGPEGWRLSPSPQGAVMAVPVFLRSLAAVSSVSFLALTTPVVEGAALLGRLPALRTVSELALLVYRFLQVLSGTARAMRLSQEARLGYGSTRLAYRSMAALAAGLLPLALERARRLERGLAARGFEGDLPVLPVSRSLSLPALAGIITVQVAVATLAVGLAGWRP